MAPTYSPDSASWIQNCNLPAVKGISSMPDPGHVYVYVVLKVFKGSSVCCRLNLKTSILFLQTKLTILLLLQWSGTKAISPVYAIDAKNQSALIENQWATPLELSSVLCHDLFSLRLLPWRSFLNQVEQLYNMRTGWRPQRVEASRAWLPSALRDLNPLGGPGILFPFLSFSFQV